MAAGASGRPTRASLAVGLAALLPRLYVAIAWTREPVWDGHYYDIGARSIAAGLGYVGTSGGAWSHYPVGYSGFLGLFYWLFGPGQYVGPIVNALCGAALAVATHRVARYAVSETRALVAGLLCALYPGLIVYTALLMTEPLAALSIMAAAWVALARPGRSGVLWAGLLIGLGALVRPQSILCAPAILLLRPGGARAALRQWKPALAAGALCSALALAVVSPWSVRNCLVMDGCAFVSTNAGWNLAIGSFPRATGRFATLRGSDGCRVVTGQVQQDRCWWAAGRRWIAADPERWLRLVPKKLSYTFDHESFPIGYLGEADPTRWPEARKHTARGVLTQAHRALLVAAPFGVLRRPRGKQDRWVWVAIATCLVLIARGLDGPPFAFWPLALATAALGVAGLAPRDHGVRAYACWVVASVCAVHAVFFGEDRYHMVAVPLLCILAAAALAQGEPAAGGHDAPAADDEGTADEGATGSSSEVR